MSMTVDGVILAAGASSRMERPKALLEVGGLTFLERAARTLRAAGCARVIAVVPAGAEWLDAVRALELHVVENGDAGSEQIASLRLALAAVGAEADGVLVLPVDLPLVLEQTAIDLVSAFRDEGGSLWLPFHNTVAGHPVLLGRALFDEVLNSPLEEGIRSLIMDHARDLREVKVVDPGILIDIDTPDDYWRYIQNK